MITIIEIGEDISKVYKNFVQLLKVYEIIEIQDQYDKV